MDQVDQVVDASEVRHFLVRNLDELVDEEEDLDDQFGAAFISAINGGVDVGASVTVLNTVPVAELPTIFAAFAADGSLTPNTAFDGDGDITLLDANQVLGVGRYVAVEFTVTDISDGIAHLDGNHPLAGQTLVFEVEIQAIRDASSEELTQGKVLD